MGYVRRFARPDQAALARPVATDPDWVSEYPAVHDYLTAMRDDTGATRRTSTLTIFAEQGSWKCFLNERTLNASLCATGPTIKDAVAALEIMLEAEDTPWRWNEARTPPGPRKGKSGS